MWDSCPQLEAFRAELPGGDTGPTGVSRRLRSCAYCGTAVLSWKLSEQSFPVRTPLPQVLFAGCGALVVGQLSSAGSPWSRASQCRHLPHSCYQASIFVGQLPQLDALRTELPSAGICPIAVIRLRFLWDSCPQLDALRTELPSSDACSIAAIRPRFLWDSCPQLEALRTEPPSSDTCPIAVTRLRFLWDSCPQLEALGVELPSTGAGASSAGISLII